MTLLRIDASIRSEGSISRAVADSVQAAWQAEHPGVEVVRRDLGQDPISARTWMAATLTHNRRQAARRLGLSASRAARRALRRRLGLRHPRLSRTSKLIVATSLALWSSLSVAELPEITLNIKNHKITAEVASRSGCQSDCS